VNAGRHGQGASCCARIHVLVPGLRAAGAVLLLFDSMVSLKRPWIETCCQWQTLTPKISLLQDAYRQLYSVRPCNPKLFAIREATCDLLYGAQLQPAAITVLHQHPDSIVEVTHIAHPSAYSIVCAHPAETLLWFMLFLLSSCSVVVPWEEPHDRALSDRQPGWMWGGASVSV
jgi:hypothetical protein